METGEKGRLGTIYFPIAFGAIIFMFWGRPVSMVAAMMPLTWGDAMAAIVGRRYGEHSYTLMGSTRSLEGSVAMLFWSWVATSIALFGVPYLVGAPAVEWLLALIYGGVVALACTIVEALSPWGIDNLTIPAAAAIVINAFLSF
jgi:phytol kinase